MQYKLKLGVNPVSSRWKRMEVDHNLSWQSHNLWKPIDWVQRYSILEESWDNTELRPLWYYNFRQMIISDFIGLGLLVNVRKPSEVYNDYTSFWFYKLFYNFLEQERRDHLLLIRSLICSDWLYPTSLLKLELE